MKDWLFNLTIIGLLSFMVIRDWNDIIWLRIDFIIANIVIIYVINIFLYHRSNIDVSSREVKG